MTGSTWINLLYEVMNERGLIDSRVEIDDLPELIDLVKVEAAKDGDITRCGSLIYIGPTDEFQRAPYTF